MLRDDPRNRLSDTAKRVAQAVEAQGGSPREALMAAKKASGQKNLTYKPHCGARQRARAAERMARASAQA